ncbi:hypothetical protein [Celeribacter sp. PS-C1]|uniref:hypothetical protein n=1 Tax=Celeribacter sp. PS-C1 TaxID=2820813 RepID=UPI001CA5F21C|nr:hypothetical protein [Celeribacter sp. PS-C1]MBW6419692.1 hypothetical protein [Celeribacter sp. PS-C1]
MKIQLKLASAGVAALLVAGCVEMDDPALSGTPDQFSMMKSPCVAQAARLTGTSAGSVTILDEIQTGGGPILTLMAGGSKYTCRLEDDGTVTVFSEYAN